MKFKFKRHGAEYPVTVTKKDGQFILVLKQIHGNASVRLLSIYFDARNN